MYSGVFVDIEIFRDFLVDVSFKYIVYRRNIFKFIKNKIKLNFYDKEFIDW